MLAERLSRLAPHWLPNGRALPEVDWRPRHRVMTLVLAAHLPVIFCYALLAGSSIGHALAEAMIPASFVALAVGAKNRLAQSSGVGLGLVSCSAIFVHLSEGLIEWHFHYFVVLALISLYQEWRVYLFALGFVVVQHAVGSALRFDSVYNHGNGELWWALVHGGFVLAASACQITFWKFNELATDRAERLHRELTEGEHALLARLEHTARMRRDLIATASHEFRTPLTVIKGAATTLLRHEHKLSQSERTELIESIVDRSERLSKMLESMLVAAQVERIDEDAQTPLASVLADVLAQPAVADDAPLVDVHVEGDIWVACGRASTHQMLERLVDNARLHSDGGRAIWLRASMVPGYVEIEVGSASAVTDARNIGGLLEPFQDSAPAGRGGDVGLGLYAVRRVAEVHGGSAAVRLDNGYLVITVRLPLAAEPAPDAVAAPVPSVAMFA